MPSHGAQDREEAASAIREGAPFDEDVGSWHRSPSHSPDSTAAALLSLYARVITESPEDQPIEGNEIEILRRFAPRLLRSLGQE